MLLHAALVLERCFACVPLAALPGVSDGKAKALISQALEAAVQLQGVNAVPCMSHAALVLERCFACVPLTALPGVADGKGKAFASTRSSGTIAKSERCPMLH